MVAQVQAVSGDIDGAFESLARHAATPAWQRGINYRSEFYANLHQDPRREQYLQRLGLSEAQRKAINFKCPGELVTAAAAVAHFSCDQCVSREIVEALQQFGCNVEHFRRSCRRSSCTVVLGL